MPPPRVPSVPEDPDETPEEPDPEGAFIACNLCALSPTAAIVLFAAASLALGVLVLAVVVLSDPLITDRVLPSGMLGVSGKPDVLTLGVGSTQPVLLPTVEGAPRTGGTAAAGAAGMTPAGPKSPTEWFRVFEFKTAGGIGVIGPSPKGPQ